ncbi:hypothetical protein BOX15_Mlig003010g1 [Macrostomum lignano]|uniref:Sm domain-containing protein n=1 Tax=Macrostomum lignano TaxID=282301 RepID=A0A267FTP1_9PLAT|nr:hypothetical protein BOX15_Mlig003010g1 [Macrostomum lignano]
MAPPSGSSSASQVPYIGSTISLLSKAGIRYEGFLHSIDQKEASVTLDHVRVFGTEERQCERRVPPSSETFEYIIFRAADITELRVIDTPLSRPVPDPAIIRVQVKGPGNANASSSSSAVNGTGGGGEATGGRAAGGGGGRRRQPRGISAGRGAGGRSGGRGQTQQMKQQAPPPQHPHLAPPPPMMQLPMQSPPQQQPRSRNDYIVYPRYNVSYRGNGAGYYPQYRPASMYPAVEFAAAPGNHGYGMRPSAGGGGGGRPVMHFRRVQGGGSGGPGAQRLRLSPRLIGSGGGGGRGRNSRRTHQSNGIAEASANPAKYFSADYDFETANAEMAKLLLTAVNSTSAKQVVVANGGINGASDEENSASSTNGVNGAVASSSASALMAAAVADGQHQLGGAGYDRDRSFFDDISRVDADAGAAAGGDSARLGRKEAARQNALNRETFGLTGRRFHGNHQQQHHRVAVAHAPRRSPV